ncbi:QDE-2-interacting protein [Fusarium sp. NRRL 52700]|nr:QDE-2-interacting protein [Fusarium sp. NRRL 52700]
MTGTGKFDDSWFKCPELFVPRWLIAFAIEGRRLSRLAEMQIEVLQLLARWHSAEEDSSVQILSIEITDEETSRGEVQSFQIGISILDTIRLGEALAKPPEPNVNVAGDVVKSYHWVVGDQKYCGEFEKKFRYGMMRYLPIGNFDEEIVKIIRNKNFVLITHGPDKSLAFLKCFGVHLEPIQTIDIEQVAQKVLHVSPGQGVKRDEFVQEMGFNCTDPQIAGNAAHLTLRILLMLLHKDMDRQPRRDGVPMDQWSLLLKRIVGSKFKKKLVQLKNSPIESSETSE